ncbi:hypothetical protein L6164_030433 [Bauhinia variegata]|uniref:Uncharacterized protein n=1 Tax=Bauhinia variegata TaxID=167791 RepID=A0ACB9LCQ1_BAUVA|nr:hypothetical protein L6164_030433 [Bauhinia variegata]
MGSDPKRRKTGSIMETAKTSEARSYVPGKEGKNLLVEQNLQVSDVSFVAKKKSNSVVECDAEDEDYLAFLDSDKKPRDGTLVERKFEESNSGREKIGSRTKSGNNLNSDMADDGSFICILKKGTERKFEESDLGGVKIGSPTKFEKNLKSEGHVGAKEGKFSILGEKLQVSDYVILPSNNRPCLDISSVAKHKCDSEVQCDAVDDDHQEFLSSTRIFMNDDCSYSDSELVIMDSDPYHENTPFISSKTYDSSVRNHGENWLLCVTRDSQFRKGLMEFLERPYDQGEYERYWQEICCRKQKERHRETRSGKIESCPRVGVNKSYLKLHKDLKEAIDGAKEQHKVLFLLRGFFYWLEEGSFQPWLDASCLEMLAKM